MFLNLSFDYLTNKTLEKPYARLILGKNMSLHAENQHKAFANAAQSEGCRILKFIVILSAGYSTF